MNLFNSVGLIELFMPLEQPYIITTFEYQRMKNNSNFDL